MTKTKKGQNSIPTTVETRDISGLASESGNIYETLAIISKRANQISSKEREELHAKLAEFASTTDNLEEVFENREQIEISRFYERQPKPTLVAFKEYLDKNIYFRSPAEEKSEKEKESPKE